MNLGEHGLLLQTYHVLCCKAHVSFRSEYVPLQDLDLYHHRYHHRYRHHRLHRQLRRLRRQAALRLALNRCV